MAARNILYDAIALARTDDFYYLRPNQRGAKILCVDRSSHRISHEVDKGQMDALPLESICGIVGIINLLAGPYMVVITRRREVGMLLGQRVWRIEEIDVLPYARKLNHLGQHQLGDEQYFLLMLRTVLQTPYFYFSYTTDLTHTQQRIAAFTTAELSQSFAARADPRFAWNRALQTDLFGNDELAPYLLPIVHGFISIQAGCAVSGHNVDYALVSRRAVTRAGTRFFRRGIDLNGFVANFVETEQIVVVDRVTGCHVQTRGSIPVFWEQIPNLKYAPTIRLVPGTDHTSAFRRHIDEQLRLYQRIVAVDLINQQGREKVIGDAFAELIGELHSPQVKYVSFDFHHECAKMRWDRLDTLLARLDADQQEQGYFLAQKSPHGQNEAILQFQTGVFRVNCIDCLDRTNVVQSMIARKTLIAMLRRLSLLSPTENLERHPSLELALRAVWTDNANTLSIQYSGTEALKTDFTRTGKRTKQGMLQDGVNSAMRYYKNNFADGLRQDSIDLLLGNYPVSPGLGVTQPSPFTTAASRRVLVIPLVLALALIMLTASLLFPPPDGRFHFAYVMFWLVATIVCVQVMVYFGKEFVDMPRLCPGSVRGC
eukprot:m.236546 g.236546  ORF g.236546 m.236546 type:complete len:599 (-) comp20649_c0_seq1:102-1898(-)